MGEIDFEAPFRFIRFFLSVTLIESIIAPVHGGLIQKRSAAWVPSFGY
jgi:hypothetical protein